MAYSASAGIHLERLIESPTNSEQKVDCLKLLVVVIKNLADPVKVQDPKYRLLRLDNEKIKAKLLPCPAALDYLKAIGFAETTDDKGEHILKIECTVDTTLMKASLFEVDAGLKMLTPSFSSTNVNSVKKARTSYVEEKKTDDVSTPSVTISFPEKLSEKQKARMLREEKEKQEREESKRHRARTEALIKADKFVREKDENWTSGVSAAAAKGGQVIATFREKFGED